jgi:hypothetical protein
MRHSCPESYSRRGIVGFTGVGVVRNVLVSNLEKEEIWLEARSPILTRLA